MERIPISRFKATCLAVIERVRTTGNPVVVTKRGVPVATIGPPPGAAERPSAFGALADAVGHVGDVVTPLPAEDWEIHAWPE